MQAGSRSQATQHLVLPTELAIEPEKQKNRSAQCVNRLRRMFERGVHELQLSILAPVCFCRIGRARDDSFTRLEIMAPSAMLVQAKTYYGGGLWYSLELDYPRIAALLKKHKFNGYVSQEF